MNKKFSTLVASLLLASGMTAFTASAQTSTLDGKIAAVTETTYAKGSAYFLKVGAVTGGNTYLVADVDAGTGKAVLKVKTVVEDLRGMEAALWVASVSTSGEQPTFTFTNRATGTILAIDKAGVVAIDKSDMPETTMGGDIYQWYNGENSTSASVVGDISLYAPYDIKDGKTRVVVLAYNETTGNVYGKVMLKEDMTTGITPVKFDLNTYSATFDYYLTVNEINTQLGKIGTQTASGVKATANNFFKLNVPHAVSEGQFNIFQEELQAQAYQRWEVKYGTDGTKKEEISEGDKAGDFVSIYPASSASHQGSTADRLGNIDAYARDAKEFILYSKKMKEYVVVDTAYIPGTEQTGRGLFAFATDGLYNAKNETRYRLPESYIFRFKYEPNSGKVTIISKGYVEPTSFKASDKAWVGAHSTLATTENLQVYYGSKADEGTVAYSEVPVKLGSYWPAVDYVKATADKKTAAESTDNGTATLVELTAAADQEPSVDANKDKVLFYTYANLVGTTVHTLGTYANADKVSLSLDAMYKLRNLTAGVYTFKVVGVANSANASRIGKYLVKTLDGKAEYIEQAVRQDYQEMPAAQWVVKSTGTSASYAPVTVRNREFDGVFEANIGGFVYSGGADDQIFFYAGDTLKYEKVAAANDARLGYKYLTDTELQDGVYTFNYLHELAMDKPINSKVDSAVWVDKDGNAIKFQLEKVVDDNYGYNGSLSGVAQLKRIVYQVRVKEDSKFDNINRYLAYDKDQRKYYLASEKDKASYFFLKENNKTESDRYYTLLEVNLAKNVMLGVIGENEITLEGDVVPFVVIDKDVRGENNKNGDGKERFYVYVKKVKDGGEDVNGKPIDIWEAYSSEDYYAVPEESKRAGVVAKQQYSGVTYFYISSGTSDEVVNERYASTKVSVDNNTLDLVNGVIANSKDKEVANSAFAVKTDDTRIYRRLGDAEGEKMNADNVVKFFRVNATAKEYLYEDGNSVYSKDKDMNFLGVEGKGDSKKGAMLARYTSGDRMPQYLIAVDTTIFSGSEYICPECGLTTCEHSKIEKPYTQGRFLVNLTDSINYYANKNVAQAKRYQWNDVYTRLAFVDARLMGDSLIIMHSAYTGNKTQIDPRDSKTIASKDTINIAPNHHNPALFQFRLLNDGSNDFLIESESWDGAAFAGGIAPMNEGGWVKIQNGVPVVVKTTWKEAYKQAEIFNLELTSEIATDIEGADAASIVVTGGNGIVTVQNAAGEQVIVSTVLGQELANTIATSDNAQISVSATGVVFVTVAGETTKVVVK